VEETQEEEEAVVDVILDDDEDLEPPESPIDLSVLNDPSIEMDGDVWVMADVEVTLPEILPSEEDLLKNLSKADTKTPEGKYKNIFINSLIEKLSSLLMHVL
jgi:hypothetical protein